MSRSAPLLAIVLAIAFSASPAEEVEPPAWWSAGENPIVDPSASPVDYGAAVVGQLMNMAKGAQTHLNATDPATPFPGGAGAELDTLVTGWENSGESTHYAALLVGQLKAVADTVYSRLIAEGYELERPWDAGGVPDRDFMIATTGQVKAVFAFDVHLDDDGDGVPNMREKVLGTAPDNPDTDGDGVLDGIEIAEGTDPNDYYNGVVPTMSIVSGDGQTASGPTLDNAVVVEVSDAQGDPLENAPVNISMEHLGALVREHGTTDPFQAQIELRTGTDGRISIEVQPAS